MNRGGKGRGDAFLAPRGMKSPNPGRDFEEARIAKGETSEGQAVSRETNATFSVV